MKHDAELCPRFQKQIERIFSGFKKYQALSYEIQGLRDEGTDVLLIEWVNQQKEFVSFQLKGEWDLNQKDYLQKLKAQYHDATERYGDRLVDYYIVLCYSIVSRPQPDRSAVIDKARIQTIKSVVRAFDRTDNVRIVEPEYAAWFLWLGEVQMDAIIKSRFGDQDIVFKEALDITKDLAPMETVVLVLFIWLHLFENTKTISAEEFLELPVTQRLHQELGAIAEEHLYEFEYQIAHDLETLQNKYLECDSEGYFSLPLNRVQPLVALMMDGSVRYEHDGHELLEYTLRVLRILERSTFDDYYG
jgi:hypothetical protein